MSAVGKIVVVGAVGWVCYNAFVEKRNPIYPINTFWVDPVKEANKDYIQHKTKSEAEFMEKNATHLQDEGAQRAITQNK